MASSTFWKNEIDKRFFCSKIQLFINERVHQNRLKYKVQVCRSFSKKCKYVSTFKTLFHSGLLMLFLYLMKNVKITAYADLMPTKAA